MSSIKQYKYGDVISVGWIVRVNHAAHQKETNFFGHIYLPCLTPKAHFYYSKNLIKEVDVQVSAIFAKNPNILHETIPICLVDTIKKCLLTLHTT